MIRPWIQQEHIKIAWLRNKGYSRFWKPADTLQEADIEIIDQQLCNSIYNCTLSEYVICAGTKSGSSKGDSGGSLYTTDVHGKKIQIGVVSGGKKVYTSPDAPTLYTRVSYYRNWIDSIMKSYSPPVGIGGEQDELLKSFSQTRNTISLTFAKSEEISYSINAMDGKLFRSSQLKSSPNTRYDIDISPLQNGLYFINYLDSRSGVYSRKFCKF